VSRASALAEGTHQDRGNAGALTCRVQFARVQFENSMHMAPRSWELIALSLLAGLGFGLALGRGDLIFVAVFGAACAMAIIGGMQRLALMRW
jgi:hypothetical protein